MSNFIPDLRRRGSVGSHILRNNNLAQDVLNGSGMSSGNQSVAGCSSNMKSGGEKTASWLIGIRFTRASETFCLQDMTSRPSMSRRISFVFLKRTFEQKSV